MRLSRSLFTPAVLLAALTGCGGASEAISAGSATVPAAVICADAPRLRQQALDDRLRSGELKSDRGKIIAANRAKFFASLAAIAELTCTGATGQAEHEVQQALEVARTAQATRSEYEAAFRWAEADLIAADAVALLIRERSAVSSPEL